MPKNHYIDISGQRFGKLVAIYPVWKRDKNGISKVFWHCRCDCGNEKDVYNRSLRKGLSNSCGCIVKKHGDCQNGAETRLYGVWHAMMQRCYDKNRKEYARYGGAGITVCDEWHEYSAFKEWAFNNGYLKDAKPYECTIDRIDNQGNYSPSNCRWVDMKTQNRNRKNNFWIVVFGERMILMDAVKKYKMDYRSTWNLIKRDGIPPDEVFREAREKLNANL